MAIQWIPMSAYAPLPPYAVIGGHDEDGSTMYVGRAMHEGVMHVCKILPSKQIGFVSSNGMAIPKDQFEILCGEHLNWHKSAGLWIMPQNAVTCGQLMTGQSIYIGRGHYEGTLTVGRISIVHRALFIAFRGGERRLESYEVLLDDSATSSCYPTLPVDDTLLNCKLSYAPQAPPMELLRPAVLTHPTKPFCATTPCCVKPAEIYQQQTTIVGRPPPTVQATCSSTVCYCRTVPSGTWLQASENHVPTNALIAGHDVDQTPLVVCRAQHNGELILGKAAPKRREAYIPYGGQELHKAAFEVLLENNSYWWAPGFSDGNVPTTAFIAGNASSGERLYIGRAHFRGSLTPGQIQPSHRCLHIAFGGAEHRITNYEVLIGGNAFHASCPRKMLY